ncbi:MAG: tripartite tricarboxylate transporter substrate binding protein [Burkholderiales bacterium]|nr:tripartite tricarboxylate transporter substrate binding protein [Burkholderiales bacterium]
MNRLFRISPFLLFIGLIATASAHAQWPQRPIRIVVAAPGGSSVDIVARLIAAELRPRLRQAIIIDNKPGAGGTLAAAEVAKSAADGYTLFLGFNGPLANAPSLYASLNYNPSRDFVPIILTSSQPNLLAVAANLPVNSLKELVALAKAQPGKLSYASVGNGSVSHLCMELLKRQAGVDLLHVPFNGGPPAVLAVAAGEVQVIFAAPSNLMAQLKSGKMKALAVTSLKRFAPVSEIPTVAESGVAGLAQFEAIAWNGLVAPAGTPTEIVSRLNREISAVLAMPMVTRKLFDAGIEAGGGTPEAFGQLMKSEAKKWADVILYTGAKID